MADPALDRDGSRLGVRVKTLQRISLVFGALLIAFFLWLSVLVYGAFSSVPSYEGEFAVEGLEQPVVIHRDHYAIPRIEAGSELDTLFALGFVHAQDRLWQMELSKRVASGRVAEIFGAQALGSDEWMRTFDWTRNAERSFAAFAPQDRRRLEAYSAGVNAWIDSDNFVLPPEYRLTFTTPERWRPVDSVLIWKLIARAVGSNLSSEIARRSVSRTAPESSPHFPYPKYPDDGHVALSEHDLRRTMGDDYPQRKETDTTPDVGGDSSLANAANPAARGPAIGSNSWVVAGRRTISGAPMVAGDYHLSLTTPSVWHLAELRYGGRRIFGAMSPGIPLVAVGRNDSLAWSGTANRSDTQDTYIEKLNPAGTGEYLTPDGWKRFESREEVFDVRFGDDLTRRYRTTRNGFVFEPDVVPGRYTTAEKDTVLSMAWVASRELDFSVAAGMTLLRAETVDEFLDASVRYTAPPANLTFAHIDGSIGAVVVGRVPRRADGHTGLVSTDGSSGATDWQGMLPAASTPRVVNPQNGAVVTANAQMVPNTFPDFRGFDRMIPDRADRIQTLIDATRQHSFDTFADIQLDVVNPYTSALLETVRNIDPLDEASRELLETFTAWDGSWQGTAPVPFLMAAQALDRTLHEDEYGELAQRMLRNYDPMIITQTLEHYPELCDDIRTPEQEGCAQMLQVALQNAAARWSGMPEAIRATPWEERFVQHHPHLGLDPFPILGEWFSLRGARAGGPGAPNVGGVNLHDLPEVNVRSWAPSERIIIDLARNEVRAVVSTGQSGHFRSPHYADQKALWEKGEYLTIDLDAEPGSRWSKMVLRPD